MNKIFLSAFLILFAGGVFGDDSLKSGSVACMTKKSLEEVMYAVARDDLKGFQYCLKNKGCSITNSKVDISVLDISILKGWAKIAKIRVYFDGRAFEMWAFIEDIQREK